MDELIKQVKELHKLCTRKTSASQDEGRMGFLMDNIVGHDEATPQMKDFIEAVRGFRESKGYGTADLDGKRVHMEAAYKAFLQSIGEVGDVGGLAEEDDDSSPLFISAERDDR